MVSQPGPAGVELTVGYLPKIDQCDHYADALGHLTPAGAEAVAGRIAHYYKTLDTPTP